MNDSEYMNIAKCTSAYSTCLKRKLGCVLVTSSGLSIDGTNGPPHGLRKCKTCPRIHSKSGTDIHLCRAVHAERATLLKAAMYGIATNNAKLYCYFGVPCKDCLLEIIAAGVSEIICTSEDYYDELSKSILQEWIEHGGKFRIYKPDE